MRPSAAEERCPSATSSPGLWGAYPIMKAPKLKIVRIIGPRGSQVGQFLYVTAHATSVELQLAVAQRMACPPRKLREAVATLLARAGAPAIDQRRAVTRTRAQEDPWTRSTFRPR